MRQFDYRPIPERGRETAVSYRVLSITRAGEVFLASFSSFDMACDDCIKLWSARKPGSPVYVVHDTETGDRWSYADIKDFRKEFGTAQSPSDKSDV